MAADKEIMKAIERLRLDRPGLIYQEANGASDFTVGTALTLALTELARTYREEAELWSRSGAKGWKGSEAEKYLVAQHIDDVAAQLDNAEPAPRPEPVGQTAPATTHERLDDLVQSAVAEGRGMLIEDRQRLKEQLGEAELSDVAAYLKGELDTLPGMAEALVPSSVTDRTQTLGELLEGREVIDTVDGAPVFGPKVKTAVGPDFTETVAAAKLAELPDLSATMTTTVPTTWESETMTADGHRLPGLAPTLGQPGDNSGMGYSHSYVPPGGRQVTYAELLTPVPASSLPAHLSHSQGNTIGDCATKYRLQRVEQLPQIPQWANIGGTAFHACAEHIERMMAAKPGLSLAAFDVEEVWKHHLEGQITAVAMTTPVPQSVWRSARKGAEGEQWWRVNGPLMLRRYLDTRPADATWAPVGEPAIELDRTVDVPTPYGPIPFNAKIDRVTISEDGRTLTIRDYKTSYERPTDTTQLGDYAWVLAFADTHMMAAGIKILGTYFDARRGEWTTPVDLLAEHPFEAFQYRVTTAHAQRLALTTGPTPARPSSFCGGCSVRYACPIMAAKS